MKIARFLLVSATALALALPLAAASNSAPQRSNAVVFSQGEYIPAMPAHKDKTPPASEDERLARAVRHELVMQPYYGMWDWLAFRVNNGTVELIGETRSNGLHRDAVNSVKRIEGVKEVVDRITELPPSPMDDEIRHRVARAIFGWGSMSRYSWPAAPAIHIIVNGGRVTLEGLVDTQGDKDAAFIRANGVSGVFAVTNNLRVARS